MFKSIRTVFRLWGVYAKLDLLWFLRDTRYCLLQILVDTMAVLASVSAVLLVCARFGGVGGLSSDEVLFLCGYAALTDGIFMLFVGGSNIGIISRVISRGQIDHMLIQPVPIWSQLLTGGFQPFSGSGQLICGAVLTAAAAQRVSLHVTALWLFFLILNLFCSVAVIVAFIYLFSCCAFFAPVASEEIAAVVQELFSDTKSYPLGGFSRAGKAAFTTLVPVGLAAWLPSCVLLGKTSGLPALLTPAAAVFFGAAAAYLFRKGILHYEKNGSIRYTGFGHR